MSIVCFGEISESITSANLDARTLATNLLMEPIMEMGMKSTKSKGESTLGISMTKKDVKLLWRKALP